MKNLAVLDYGMSNLHSVQRALTHVAGNDWRITVSNQASVIEQADKVVFPGQGAMGNAMELLRKTGLDQAVLHTIHHKPFLGICLGLQTLLAHSEENNGTEGFGVVPGAVRRFSPGQTDPDSGDALKIPQMGWNRVFQQQDHPLWQGIEDGSRFYFVHSYYAAPDKPEHVAGMSYYPRPYASALAFEQVFAVQFHPEKSQTAGLRLLQNFIAW